MAVVKTIFGIFINAIDAKSAIAALKEQTYSPKEIALILKEEPQVGRQTASSPTIEESKIIAGLSIGAAIGGVVGLLIGLGVFTPVFSGIAVVASALNVTKTLASTTIGIIVGGAVGGFSVIGKSYVDQGNIPFLSRRGTALGETTFVVIPARPTETDEIEAILKKHNVSAIHSFKISTDISFTSEYILNGGQRFFEEEYPRQRRKTAGIANVIEVQKYLKHVDYPMSKEGLVHEAEIEGADEAVINTLERLPEQEFTSPTVVNKALGTLS